MQVNRIVVHPYRFHINTNGTSSQDIEVDRARSTCKRGLQSPWHVAVIVFHEVRDDVPSAELFVGRSSARDHVRALCMWREEIAYNRAIYVQLAI